MPDVIVLQNDSKIIIAGLVHVDTMIDLPSLATTATGNLNPSFGDKRQK